MADRDVYNVIAGEAKYGAGSFDDMLGVASAIFNRSQSLGVSPGNVVRNRNEFNAYGKSLPKGASVSRARDAWNQVVQQGPVHTGTFYATPAAVGNLPKGLSKVHQTLGHQYFSDPQNRSINTALGYRQPTALTGAQRAIAAQTTQPRQPANVPTPTFAQRAAPTLSASLASNPVNPASVRSASSVPAGLTSMAQIGSRVGPSTAYGIPTPTSRPSAPTQVASRAPDPSRFGNIQTETMPAAMQDRFAELAGVKGSRVAPQSVMAGLAPTPAQEANLRDRLGTFTPTVNVASLRTRSVPTPTAAPRSFSVGDMLGVSQAKAATPPQGATTSRRAPVSSAMLTGSLTPGAVGSITPRTPVAPADRLASHPPASVPVPTAASRVPTPTGAPRTVIASLPQRTPTPTARPQMAASSIRTAPTAQRTTATPTRQTQAVARDPWGGLRVPAAVSQPQVAQPASGPFGIGRGSVGRVAGDALGGVVAGPLGALLGGVIGGRIGNNGMTAGGRGGPAGSNGGRSSSGRSSGGSAFESGFGGFTERDSAVGLDGGKVGGASRSSSGNAGRSGSSSGGKSSSSGGKSGGGKGGKK